MGGSKLRTKRQEMLARRASLKIHIYDLSDPCFDDLKADLPGEGTWIRILNVNIDDELEAWDSS